MGRIFSFTIGLLLGGAIGAGAGLLLTPGSGDELRKRLRAEVQDILDQGRKAAEARQHELEAELEGLRKA